MGHGRVDERTGYGSRPAHGSGGDPEYPPYYAEQSSGAPPQSRGSHAGGGRPPGGPIGGQGNGFGGGPELEGYDRYQVEAHVPWPETGTPVPAAGDVLALLDGMRPLLPGHRRAVPASDADGRDVPVAEPQAL